jgi:hypothetical protein
MNNELEKLELDLASYREAVDRIFSSAPAKPADWQQCLREILICASQLYLDYLIAIKNLPSMEAVSSKGNSDRIRGVMLREREEDLRERLLRELEFSACWKRQFKPENAFSELTGLRSRRDYIDKLTLHLPEIYEESFRVEACAKDFIASRTGSALAQLAIRLQHLSRNHISFVLQALEWAADEDSWEELSAVPKGRWPGSRTI